MFEEHLEYQNWFPDANNNRLVPFNVHSQNKYQVMVSHLCETGNEAALDWLQARGMKNHFICFWQLPKIQLKRIWKPHFSHNIYHFLLKHQMELVQEFLGEYKRLEQFDKV